MNRTFTNVNLDGYDSTTPNVKLDTVALYRSDEVLMITIRIKLFWLKTVCLRQEVLETFRSGTSFRKLQIIV